MARLFASAVLRDPEPAPPGWVDRRTIYTHPEASPQLGPSGAATSTRARQPAKTIDPVPPPQDRSKDKSVSPSLHDQLFGAWTARDWKGLVAVARDHLSRSGPTPALDPVAAAAIAFFRPREVKLREGDVEQFLAHFPEKQLGDYFRTGHERQRGRIADDALALHCLGMLGEARFDYLGALRSLEALAAAGAQRRKAETRRRISPAWLNAIGNYEVALPDWSFDIQVCRHSDSDEGWPRESLVERKIAQVQRRETVRLGDDACDCTREEPACTPQDPCCAEVHYYIADLLELRDWAHRYKAGDIAYIQVLAPGEKLSRTHIMKRTRELFSETETSERSQETRDLQVTDTSSLTREIERQQEQKISAEASATGTYDSGAYKLTVTASGSFSRTTSEAVKEAQENAVETVKKALSEIEKKTMVKRSERLTTEETEKNVHSFENETSDPFVTQYFWVNQERRAQLYSYGKRLLAEFILPEPGRLYEQLVKMRRDAEIEKRVQPPRGIEPEAPDFDLKPADVNGENYQLLCEEWGVKDPPAWPPPTMQISDSEIDDWERKGTDIPLDTLHFSIPAGYEAVAMDLAAPRLDFLSGTAFQPKKIEFIGPDTLYIVSGGTPKDHAALNPHVTGYQAVSIAASHTSHVHVIVTMSLIRQPGVLEVWQKTVFNLLYAQYEKALAAYEEKMKPWDAYWEAWKALELELIAAERSRNPFFNREIERTELKRAVIYLMCQDFSLNGAMIRKAEPCGFIEIDRTATDKQGYEWYFWDRLIDWKMMAYAFFDYFWNPMCDWPDRFDPDEPDALFKAFRRAGYARLIVPVSTGMEGDFLWYLNTHQKWGPTGKPGFGPSDLRWRNVVYELGHANASAMTAREGRVEVDPTKSVVILKGSDRYWDPGPGTPAPGVGMVDPAAIALDIDREIYLEGEVYLVTAIVQSADPNAPQFDPTQPNSMWWELTLDRVYAGPAGTRLYAMGAQAVAPVFSFDVPTELIWAGEKNKCLPTYPLPDCVD